LITVDVSASTEAFVRTVCLITVRRFFPGEQDVVDVGELFFKEFHFELVYRSTYEYILRQMTIVVNT